MKKRPLLCAVLALAIAPLSVSAGKRGDITEYDPGAPKESRWPDLFAETPNYRAFGKAILGGSGEKFRWQMGPMWYRGRLTPQSVKVFVIGQEGAQDENVTNRSFTGSTGTRMQKFLNYLGIDRSYLFMNTFVYTINGQYTTEEGVPPRLEWLAQNPDSIIVEHRHKMFDYMLEQNKGTLSLVIGVGSAGKDSAVAWARAHGADCDYGKISYNYCEGKGALKGVYFVGVRHPGGASARNGGEDAAVAIRNDFQRTADIVAALIEKNPNWLKADKGAYRNLNRKFYYGHAAIPHRDFPFGTNWRMGSNGTASNRRGSWAIQVYSENGCYNNIELVDGRCPFNPADQKPKYLKYDDPKDLLGKAPKEMAPVDIPFESPKSVAGRRQYDEGPGKFAKAMEELMSVDYQALGVTQHESFGPQGVYRGRLDQAKVLVVADQVSHTDMFSGRALTGAAGQRLQSFLQAMGVQSSYGIVRTLPVDTLDLSIEKASEVALNPGVVKARKELLSAILKEGQTKLVLAVGPVAQKVVEEAGLDLPVVEMPIADPSENHVKEWQQALKKIESLDLGLQEASASYSYKGKLSVIPRADLPAYTRWWMGTSGDRAARAYEYIDGQRVDNGDYYKLVAPYWNSRWRADKDDLSPSEKASVERFEAAGIE